MRKVLAVLAGVWLVGSYLPESHAATYTCFGRTPTIVGTTGNDEITGTASTDVIKGAAGNDTIYGGGGQDLICGGGGVDEIYGQGGSDKVTGDTGLDRVFGGAGDDLVRGGSHSDVLGGGIGNDELDGQNNPNADPPPPGQWTGDTAWYVDSAGPITANLSTGTATGQGNDTLINLEDIQGSMYADTLTGNAGLYNIIDGGGGDDAISTGGGGYDNVSAGDGNDTVTGSDNAAIPGAAFDTLNGGAGDDHIDGNGGTGDKLYGGQGTNTIIGGSGVDYIFSDASRVPGGTDTIYGLGGPDHIHTNDGVPDDYVDAGEGTDTCSYDIGDIILNCP
jgi:Ca2+-binding RTX toxin-like protein